MGTFGVEARHGDVPRGQGCHSELARWSAACYFDKYGHRGTWQGRRGERAEGNELLTD